MKALRLSAALFALTLTASTSYAAGVDLSNARGPSGGYTSQAYYKGMLAGQPMSATQQAYSDQEDQLRLLGFLSELRGDMALGQTFYTIAYGITPPPSALVSADGGSGLGLGLGLGLPSITSSGLVTGASDSIFVQVIDVGGGATISPATAVPEASTWAMMLIGFVGLGFAGRRRMRERALLVK
jgi:hypothetical protein